MCGVWRVSVWRVEVMCEWRVVAMLRVEGVCVAQRLYVVWCVAVYVYREISCSRKSVLYLLSDDLCCA